MTNINKAKSKQTFLSRVGGGINVFTRVPAEMIHDHEGMYYRSDTRHPDYIFQAGFCPRDPTGLVYRLNQQDVDPERAVSITLRFDVATLFPVKLNRETLLPEDQQQYRDPPHTTFVYLVWARNIFNTQRVQARFTAHKISNQSVHHKEQAYENMYADERATQSILGKDVIAAVTIQRQWAGDDFKSGGTYAIIGYALNRRASYEHGDIQNDLAQNYRCKTIGTMLGASGHMATPGQIGQQAQAMINKYTNR